MNSVGSITLVKKVVFLFYNVSDQKGMFLIKDTSIEQYGVLYWNVCDMGEIDRRRFKGEWSICLE